MRGPEKPYPTMRLRPFFPAETVADIHLLTVGHLVDKDEDIHHLFAYHGFVMVMEGDGHYRCDGSPVQAVGPGSCFHLQPGVRYDYGPGAGRVWTEFYIALLGDGLAQWQANRWLWSPQHVRQVSRPREHFQRFLDIRALLQRQQPGDRDRAVLKTAELLCEVYYDQGDLDHDVNDPMVQTVVRHCHEHLADVVDFHALADELGVSYSLLRRQVKRVTGLPPQQLLLRLRCQQAQYLLVETTSAIQEIGDLVGMPDPFSFSRTFKKIVGQSPRHYRDQLNYPT